MMKTDTRLPENLNSNSLFFTLIICKFFERFVYYGWRAIIFIFLVENITANGNVSQDEILTTYGAIVGLIAVASLVGGYLADTTLSNTKLAFIGFLLSGAGFAMTWLFTNDFYYIPIIVITLGIGIISPNLTALIGKLFSTEPHKLLRSFSAHYIVINLGAFLSPLLVATLAQSVGFVIAIMILGMMSLIPPVLIHFQKTQFENVESFTFQGKGFNLNSFQIVGLALLLLFTLNMAYETFWTGVVGFLESEKMVQEFANLQIFSLAIVFVSLVVLLFIKPDSMKKFKQIFFIMCVALLAVLIWEGLIIGLGLENYAQFFFFILLFSVVEAIFLPLMLSLLIKFKVRFITTVIAITALAGQAPELIFKAADTANIKSFNLFLVVACLLILSASTYAFLQKFKNIEKADSQSAENL